MSDITKACTKCKIEKDLNEFFKMKKGKYGVRSVCKECGIKMHREYINERKQKDDGYRIQCNKSSHTYRRIRMHKDNDFRIKEIKRNRESAKNKLANNQEAYRKHYDKKYAKRKIAYKTDETYRLRTNLRNRFNDILKQRGIPKRFSFSGHYGIDFQSIFDRLGPRPRGYHVDHIIPLSAFDITNPRHVYLAHLPCNLRWLPASENSKKNDTIPHSLIKSSTELSAIYLEITEQPAAV